MKLATKKALLSALIFPGCGQISLKQYKRGIAIIIPFFAAALSIFWSVVQSAIGVIESSPFKKGTVSISAVIDISLFSLQAIIMSRYFVLLLTIIVSTWIFSIVDAYLLAKKQLDQPTISLDQQ